MKFLRNAAEVIMMTIYTAALAAIIVMILKLIVEPIAPILTVLLVIAGTMAACDRLMTAALSIMGLLLYATAWPATTALGIWPGMLVWTTGVILWFMAWAGSLRRPVAGESDLLHQPDFLVPRRVYGCGGVFVSQICK